MNRCLHNNQRYRGNITVIPATYSGMLTWELRNLQEQDTLCDTIPTKNGRELVEKWVSELMTNL